MLNQCTFIGRLSKDVEIRYTQNGKAVANFSLAVQREMADQNGKRHTDFFNFVVWGKPAENMANQLSKGDMIAVQSKAQPRSYEKDGKTNYVTEFIVDGFPKFLRVKKWENGGNSANNNGSTRDPFSGSGTNDYPPIPDISDDDLPF